MNIDPGSITFIQTTFLQHIAAIFDLVGRYALNLLYIFTTLEIVLFGLAWALQQNAEWGKLFFKILKIGLIFLILQNFAWLLNTIISSFAQIAGHLAHTAKIEQFVFNPSTIWQYGYDAGLFLLKKAALGNSMGLIFIDIILGAGLILTFGLLGIQVVLQLVGFYLVALTSVILMPLGAFNPTSRMFDRPVQAVLKAGIRVMVIIIIVGIASVIFDSFDLRSMASNVVNINQLLGLLFSSLLFLCLAMSLPKIVASTVGEVGDYWQKEAIAVNISGDTSREATPQSVAFSGAANMQAATTVSATPSAQGSALQAGTAGAATEVSVSSAGQVTSPVSAATPSAAASFQQAGLSGKETLALASAMQKSISAQTISQIKDILAKTVKEKK